MRAQQRTEVDEIADAGRRGGVPACKQFFLPPRFGAVVFCDVRADGLEVFFSGVKLHGIRM
jgi:hypothetical protein